jgi:hypothetical protein
VEYLQTLCIGHVTGLQRAVRLVGSPFMRFSSFDKFRRVLCRPLNGVRHALKLEEAYAGIRDVLC